MGVRRVIIISEVSAPSQLRQGNLAFFLGGKSRSDADQWQLDMKAVQAAIKYAIATGILK
jgi:hypothetical protein